MGGNGRRGVQRPASVGRSIRDHGRPVRRRTGPDPHRARVPRPLGAVAIAATAYYFAYGLAQPFWGFASDRLGRVRIIRISLGATAVACALSALAPNLDFLIFARIVAGGAGCAVLPTPPAVGGGMVPLSRRPGGPTHA